MNIRDLMTSDVQTVTPTDTAQKAAGFMLSGNWRGQPLGVRNKLLWETAAKLYKVERPTRVWVPPVAA